MNVIKSRRLSILILMTVGAFTGCGGANASSTNNVSAAPGSYVSVETHNTANGGSPTVSPSTSLQPTFRTTP